MKFGIKGEKEYKGVNNGKGMGIGPRIPKNELESWLSRCDQYNKNTQSPIDTNKDQTPGPHAYNMISHWVTKGDKLSKKKDKDEPKPNYFKCASKGASFNPYYSRID